jgi:molybdopterin/thiamine biosynthesis adenylyltransferase
MNDAERLRHERAYRGEEVLSRLAGCAVTIAGAGALGSWLAESLARQGFGTLHVIDHDRVEISNLGNQIYTQEDAGAFKVQALQNHLFRAAGVEIRASRARLEERNCRSLLRGAALIVDTLDNSEGRRLVADFCRQQDLPCLHMGMNGGYGEVHWNEHYRVPEDVEDGDVCDVPLARNLVLLLTATAGEAIIRHLREGTKQNFSITLEDLRIQTGD